MKLGFWTLYDVDWTNVEIAQRAAALEYDGVDLRVAAPGKTPGIGDNLSLSSTDQEVARIRDVFAQANVEISSLNCYNDSPSVSEAAFEQQIVDHARLAQKVGTSRIRFQITAGPPTGVTWDNYLLGIWRSVGRALDQVTGINAVVENHPDRANGEQLLATAEKVGDARIGVELSPDHVLVMQEKLLEVVDRYAPWIRHICMADRKVVQEDLARFDGRYYYVRYESCWIGDGIVPTSQLLTLLSQRGFDDYVSLKWEKSARFGHHLPSSESALEHYARYMRQFDGLRPVSKAAAKVTG